MIGITGRAQSVYYYGGVQKNEEHSVYIGPENEIPFLYSVIHNDEIGRENNITLSLAKGKDTLAYNGTLYTYSKKEGAIVECGTVSDSLTSDEKVVMRLVCVIFVILAILGLSLKRTSHA